jgi:hypothetical protein
MSNLSSHAPAWAKKLRSSLEEDQLQPVVQSDSDGVFVGDCCAFHAKRQRSHGRNGRRPQLLSDTTGHDVVGLMPARERKRVWTRHMTSHLLFAKLETARAAAPPMQSPTTRRDHLRPACGEPQARGAGGSAGSGLAAGSSRSARGRVLVDARRDLKEGFAGLLALWR